MFKSLKKKAKEKLSSGDEDNGKDSKRLSSSSKNNGHRPGHAANNSAGTSAPPQQLGKPPREEPESPRVQSLDETPPALPDYMTDSNAVLEDAVPWRHGHAPDYSAANSNFLRERANVWPPGSLEDLVSNLVKNWEKEASYKVRLQDWRTINSYNYKFSCNGGREFTADEMMQIGTYNALIQEAAFYSAKHTSFDESHEVFRRAMPGGFSWEVTEVYSGPPVVAFKWRHWGRMTGKLVCPIGPDTKLEADPTHQEVEIFGVCVCHLDSDFKIGKLEIFYDPHELMASLVDARNLSYRSPEAEAGRRSSVDIRHLYPSSDGGNTADDGYLKTVDEEYSERDGARSMISDSLASDLPTDAALLASLADRPQKSLPGSRCPFPHN